MNKKTTTRRFRFLHLLLIVPYAAVLWVPFYDRLTPEIAGIPFFYWYQMLWILLGAAALVPVYFADERSAQEP